MARDSTIIQLDFPPAPRVSERPEKQEAFEKWYYDFRTVIVRQFEELATKIDENKAAT